MAMSVQIKLTPVTDTKPVVVRVAIGNKRGWDAVRASKYARDHANPPSPAHPTGSLGRCAFYTRLAIEAGGIKLVTTEHAKDYGASLTSAGFYAVSGEPKVGDVVVIQDIKGHPHGHMAIFDGKNWISDFVQMHGFYPGESYRRIKPPYQMYRHD